MTSTLKISLMLSVITMILVPGGIIPIYAADGVPISTVEINDSRQKKLIF